MHHSRKGFEAPAAVGAEISPARSKDVTALARGLPTDPASIIRALAALGEAKDLAERNVNPQLIVANLGRLAATECLTPPAPDQGEAR